VERRRFRSVQAAGAQPLPLAGEVGAERRERALSTMGVSLYERALSPTLSRTRERERTVV